LILDSNENFSQSETVDIVEKEYRNSTEANNADRWTNFFDSYKVTRKVGVNKDEVTEKPYVNQIKAMSTAKPYIYASGIIEMKSPELEQNKDETGMGRLIFVIDYNDLVRARSDIFDKHTSDKYKKKEDKERRNISIKVLCYQLRNYWDDAKACIKLAVWKLLQRYDDKYATLVADPTRFVIVVHNFEITKTISEVSSNDLDKFCRFEVIIPQFDDQSSIELIETGYRCLECDNIIMRKVRKVPQTCPACNHRDCYIEDSILKKARDFMYFTAQDTSDKMRLGQMIANSINVCVTDMPFVQSIYNIMEVGSYVGINGVIRLAENQKGTAKTQAEFECVGVEVITEKNKYDKDIRSLVEREIPPEQIDDHYDKLVRSYAPHLQGLMTAKEILLLQAAGNTSLRDIHGSSRIRGKMNTLLLGDSSMGKTELENFHVRLNRRSVPVLGSLASKVGLTASIKKIETIRGGEKITRQSIDPGPYGICRGGGDVCIDEFDKVGSKEHYEAISSAMDDHQMLYIHKNAAHTAIHVDCGSVHAANPISGNGKYDTNLSVFKQTNFAHWLWSRYDYKVLFLSKRTDESRHMLWQHKAKAMENMITEAEYNNTTYDQYVKKRISENVDILEGDIYPFDYLVHELAYAVEKYPDPVFKPNSMAWIMMMKFWNTWNTVSIIPDTDREDKNGDKNPFVAAVDERSINSLIRAAKSSARLHRRNEVSTVDMKKAMDLMRTTIKAFIPHVDIDDEAEKEYRSAEKLVNETIRQAILFNTKELNDKITKFYLALVKLLRKMHQDYFEKCYICKGKGIISERTGYIPDTLEETIPCNACHGFKGEYNKISVVEFEKACIDTSTFVYKDEYLSLLKNIGFLIKDRGAITSTVRYSIGVSNLIAPNMLAKVEKAINNYFGLDEYAIAEQRKLLIKEQPLK
jgi:DNA replicative helicase MCM subunit Mcm2 (Cdc46/Mcm family)